MHRHPEFYEFDDSDDYRKTSGFAEREEHREHQHSEHIALCHIPRTISYSLVRFDHEVCEEERHEERPRHRCCFCNFCHRRKDHHSDHD